MTPRNNFSSFLPLFFLAIFVPGCATHPQFEGLGDLPGGKTSSFASAVSADGRVVVGQSSSADSEAEAYRWENGQMTPLGALRPGDLSSANDVSADGSTVVGTSFSLSRNSPSEAFVWKDGAMQKLGGFPCGDVGCSAQGVSGDGSIVVGKSVWRFGEKNRAFIWTQADGMLSLQELLERKYSVDLDNWVLDDAQHISDDGAVIAGTGLWNNSGYYAFRWVEGSAETVSLPGIRSANASSPDGTTLVGRRSTRVDDSLYTSELVQWKSSETAVLIAEENQSTFVTRGISACGTVVVGFGNFGDGEEAFIWTEAAGMQRLKAVLEKEHQVDLTGWILKRAEGISNDGTVIVGSGTNPEGNHEAWRVVLPGRGTASKAAQAAMECKP